MNWFANWRKMVRPYRITAHLATVGACLPILLLVNPSLAEAKQKPKKSAAKAESKEAGLVPIAIGHGAKGVKLPVRDTAGKLQMVFNMETAFRSDETHLQIEGLQIETYGEDGKSEMNIDMPASLFDLKAHLLSSEQPVTISRTDFELTGGNMTFDTQTRQGKFCGPVRMLIFNDNTQNAGNISGE